MASQFETHVLVEKDEYGTIIKMIRTYEDKIRGEQDVELLNAVTDERGFDLVPLPHVDR